MSNNSFTEVETESWWDRLKESIKGVLTGIGLFLVAFPVLFFNEGHAVDVEKALTEGAGAVVSVPADKVSPEHQGKLIHIQGKATPVKPLVDDLLNVSMPAIQLNRKVEMFQWVEEKKEEKTKKTGGSTEKKTTYEYETQWSDALHETEEFKIKKGHWNPSEFAIPAVAQSAEDVTVGAFHLPPSLVAKIDTSADLPVTEAMLAKVPAEWRSRAKVKDGALIIGKNVDKPEVGDLRIRFSVVNPMDVSVVAKQAGNQLEAYQTSAGGKVELLQEGMVAAPDMFKAAQASNVMATWFVRLLGFLMMAAGIFLFMRPLTVFADVIPLLGDMLTFGTRIFSLLIAAPLSLATIGLGWLVHRPVLGVLMLVVAIGGLVAAVVLGKRRKASMPAQVNVRGSSDAPPPRGGASWKKTVKNVGQSPQQ